MKLIVPEDNTGNKFMDQFLALLSDPIDDSRFVRYNTKTPYSDMQLKVRPCDMPLLKTAAAKAQARRAGPAIGGGGKCAPQAHRGCRV